MGTKISQEIMNRPNPLARPRVNRFKKKHIPTRKFPFATKDKAKKRRDNSISISNADIMSPDGDRKLQLRNLEQLPSEKEEKENQRSRPKPRISKLPKENIVPKNEAPMNLSKDLFGDNPLAQATMQMAGNMA